MPALNNIRAETVCDENKQLLEDFAVHELINEEGFIDLSLLELEQQKQIIKDIIKNEKSNVEASKENYQKLEYKVKNISELLVLALTLLVAGLTLAPLFIASSIILPILPSLVLFLGVAIIASTKLLLNMKINQLGINAIHADKVLNQLIESNDVDGEEISNGFNKQIREVKRATMAMSNKIDELAANNTRNFSELLVNRGTFSKTMPTSIPSHENPANVLQNRESTSSYSNS
ncbi:MAG TPA: hypothetical protein VGH95_04840 [Candidatus Aquirickettsiella sp.]|jgi:hypothetical protein